MKKKKIKHIEFIYIAHDADDSFLKCNLVLKHYNLQFQDLPLDEFERRYRDAFNLETYFDHVQDHPITFYRAGRVTTIFISTDFYNKLCIAGNAKDFLQSGYITFLKASRAIFFNTVEEAESKLAMEKILILSDDVKKNVEKLEYCLRLVRYGFLGFGTSFAYVCQEGRSILLESKKEIRFKEADYMITRYVAKDNYLLAIFLRVEANVSEYIRVALQAFDQSFHINNSKMRFIQLLLCIEICLNNFFREPNGNLIAQYTSILLSNNKDERKRIYSEVIGFYNIKKVIVSGTELYQNNDTNTQDFLRMKIGELENISRDILKKLIKLNIKEKEKLIYELKVKAAQTAYS